MFWTLPEIFPSKLTTAKYKTKKNEKYISKQIVEVLMAAAMAAGKALMAKDAAGVMKNLMDAGKV
jgi:hypothetical protein